MHGATIKISVPILSIINSVVLKMSILVTLQKKKKESFVDEP
jgi:hypothetical protein